jgi:hypothetical protein
MGRILVNPAGTARADRQFADVALGVPSGE